MNLIGTEETFNIIVTYDTQDVFGKFTATRTVTVTRE